MTTTKAKKAKEEEAKKNEAWLKSLEGKWDDVRHAVERFAGPAEAEKLAFNLINSDVEACRTSLFKAWDEAPNASWIHDVPGFPYVCDLLSEMGDWDAA